MLNDYSFLTRLNFLSGGAYVLIAFSILASLLPLICRTNPPLRFTFWILYIIGFEYFYIRLLDEGLTFQYAPYVILFTFLMFIGTWIQYRSPNNTESINTSRTIKLYLFISILVMSGILLYQLDTYSGSLLTWEDPVSRGFGRAYAANEPLSLFAEERLFWDLGVFGSSERSFLYGVPTYWLLKTFGFTTLNLRLVSVLFTLLTIILFYKMTARYFGSWVGLISAIALTLNPTNLYYARYGSSFAATIFTSVLALYTTWNLLEAKKHHILHAILSAISLYAATLCYTPARLLVLLLIGLIPVVILFRIKTARWTQLIGIILVGGAAYGVWHLNKERGTQEAFLNARGEQIMYFFGDRGYLEGYLGRKVAPENLSPCDKGELVYRVLENTVPQLLHLTLPWKIRDHEARGILAVGDPPNVPIYHKYLFPFLIFGFILSLCKIRSPVHFTLLTWFILGCSSLLLTTRVDVHRIGIFIIPISIWTSMGIYQISMLLGSSRFSTYFRHIAGCTLIAAMLLTNYAFLGGTVELPPYPREFYKINSNFKGPAILGGKTEHKDIGWMNMVLLERVQREGFRTQTVLEEHFLNPVVNDAFQNGVPNTESLRPFRESLDGDKASLILFPPEEFQKFADFLREKGYQSEIMKSDSVSFLVVYPKKNIEPNEVKEVIPTLDTPSETQIEEPQLEEEVHPPE